MRNLVKKMWLNSFVCLVCLCLGVGAAAAQTAQPRLKEQALERPILGSQRPAATYSVSGRVTGVLVSPDMAAIRGWYNVKISFTRIDGNGPAPNPAFTHTDGTWSASGFERGVTYRATASYPAPGLYDFLPKAVNITGSRSDVNFRLKASQTFAVTGRVMRRLYVDGSGFREIGVAGARMTFHQVSPYSVTPIPVTVVTDANGFFRQSGFQQGTLYNVMPQGENFSPEARPFNGADASQPLNFYIAR